MMLVRETFSNSYLLQAGGCFCLSLLQLLNAGVSIKRDHFVFMIFYLMWGCFFCSDDIRGGWGGGGFNA